MSENMPDGLPAGLPPTIVGSPRSVMAVIGGCRLRVARLSRPRLAAITDPSGRTRRVRRRVWLWMITCTARRSDWGLGTVRAFELRRLPAQSLSFDMRCRWRAPSIGNIYATGEVCWGDAWPLVARVPMRSPWCAVLDEIERLYWEYWDRGFHVDLAHERPWRGPQPLAAILYGAPIASVQPPISSGGGGVNETA